MPLADPGDLLAWYDRHARKLPWRISPLESKAGQRQDPYKVWLSEIMLQQTTVAAVIPYFENFVSRWPTVSNLAAATDDEVRAAWAGLGYYRRAANLHACAKVVAHELGGKFPPAAKELKALPGIGDYTSGAIASIAFGEAVPVVDGNVERVVTRLQRISTPLPKAKKEVYPLVEAMVPADRPGDFAQAMMDLGATICTPKNPACALCPWNLACEANKHGDQLAYPVKAPKKPKPQRFGAALVVEREDGAIWCETRPDSGLLPGMTQVPTTEWSEADAPAYEDADRKGSIQHVFTHFALELQVYHRRSDEAPTTTGWWSKPDVIAQEAWPTVMVKVLRCAVSDVGTAVNASRAKA